MKLRINICHVYLGIILLTWFNGTLYAPGGFIAQGLQYVLLLVSLYYAIYANHKYRLPVYFKGLNVLLIMFTIYGMILILSGEQIIIQASYRVTANTSYLKTILLSLLPIYAFYVFTRQGLLTEKSIRFWFFIFFILAIRSFFRSQERQLEAALEAGSSATQITSNMGYTFVGLLPALVYFQNKRMLQYILMVACAYFIVISLKRGAIICGAICIVWFLVVNLKKTDRNRRFIVLLLSVLVAVSLALIYNYMLSTSSYFNYRLAQTESGDSSGRDILYSTFFNHFINESDFMRFMLGYGANGTLKISFNFAHNDWLEIAINQGVIGLFIYLLYWIGLYRTWRWSRQQPQAFMSIGMFLSIYFLSTMFSMSYNSVTRFAAMVFGYSLAIYNNKEQTL